jgi:hypothetical protein
MTKPTKRASARGRVDRGSSRDDDAIDPREISIEEAVRAALAGETAALSRLPRDLQAEAGHRFNLRREAAIRDANRRLPPTEGIH